MKRTHILSPAWTALLLCSPPSPLRAQATPRLSDAAAERVLLGKYDPAAYHPPGWTPRVLPYDGYHQEILKALESGIDTDSLRARLEALVAFRNRNTGSDTVSGAAGIGAVRRWAFARFAALSQAAGGRMLPAYLDFTSSSADGCGKTAHRNVLAAIPGLDTAQKAIVLVEAHMDSRCEGLCDIACRADGAVDNGSGSVLVMELARVLSRIPLNRTVVLMLCTGEEQGLLGAKAFSAYAKAKGIRIHAVQNNDIVAGVLCGRSSSSPGCTVPGAVDSTHMRLFSDGDFNSPHKGFARFIKLQYREKAMPTRKVPMFINLMLPQDRTGRSGDHIPFSDAGYTAVRLIAANENGQVQHTTRDTLSLALVNFGYLARNTLINGLGAAMAAAGPAIPDPAVASGAQGIQVQVPGAAAASVFRVGIRTTNLDFDTVLTLTGPSFILPGLKARTQYIISVAAVSHGVESLFSPEHRVTAQVTTGVRTPGRSAAKPWRVRVVSASPSGGKARIAVLADRAYYGPAYVQVRDADGREHGRMPVALSAATFEMEWPAGRFPRGVYSVCLVVRGRIVDRVRADLP